jgi:hypothetical protein
MSEDAAARRTAASFVCARAARFVGVINLSNIVSASFAALSRLLRVAGFERRD